MTTSADFPGFDYVASRRIDLDGTHDSWIDIYGNHDVWPGTVPLLGRLRTRPAEQHLRQRREFSAELPDETVVKTASGYQLRFYRLNSVCSGPLANFLALGDLDTDCLVKDRYHCSGGVDPIEELVALGSADRDAKIIRIIVMHHPPHMGSLSRAGELASRLESAPCRFHMILAGHIHRLDPGLGVQLCSQSPLPHDTVQLVVGTATRRTAPGEGLPSFAVYKLRTDHRELHVARTVYEFEALLNSEFTPRPPENVMVVPLT